MTGTRTLPPRTIHLWSAWLSSLPWPLEQLEGLLTTAEREKAARHIPADRSRVIASRGMLRMLLASYLGCDPAEVPLEKTQAGKPFIAPWANPTGLEFNLSHTDRLVVYAFSDAPIGMDVEWLGRSSLEVEALARKAFCAVEYQSWRSLPAPEQHQAAVRAWTIKEAVKKAEGGTGIGTLREIEVAIGASEPMLLRPRLNWQLARYAPAPGYVATICFPADAIYAFRQQWFREEAFA